MRSAMAMLLRQACNRAMIEHDLKTLLDGLTLKPIKADDNRKITGLTADSRRVAPRNLFFALPGLRHDGDAFTSEAVGRGACAIITAKVPPRVGPVPYIQVADPRSVLAEVARRFYNHPEEALNLTGITGTNGKTTVAFLTRHILAQAAQAPVGLIGTVTYDLGGRTLPAYRTTPDIIDLMGMFRQMVDNTCGHGVMEVSSHGIDQRRVIGIPFDVAAFLNLTQDHLDYHHSMEEYFAVKSRLFDGGIGRRPRVAVINGDDPYGIRLARAVCGETEVMTFGIDDGASADGGGRDLSLRATDVGYTATGSTFTVATENDRAAVTTNLPGRYNVSNVLAAIGIAHAHGVSLADAANALATFDGVPGRMEAVACGQPYPVFVDYAHTPDAVKNALDNVRAVTPGRVLTVFGCGGDRDREKRPLMTAAALAGSDLCWATADNPRGEEVADIFEDMRAGVATADAGRIAWIEDRRQAIAAALAEAQPQDCVLIAGKGHETYQERKGSISPFDDRAVVRDLLAIKGFSID